MHTSSTSYCSAMGKSFGGTSDESAYSIIQSKDGGFLIAGRTVSVNGQVINTTGGMAGWLVKTDDIALSGKRNRQTDTEKRIGASDEVEYPDIFVLQC